MQAQFKSSSNKSSETSCETQVNFKLIEMEDNLIKYIVYLTTNKINKKIYIGVHKTNTPYKFDGYLGCGVKINDRASYRFCHTPFETAVNKYGPKNFERVTLQVFDTLQDALNLEMALVNEQFIKRKDTYNITLGGNLPPIRTKTIYQYDLHGNFIKEWDSITEASIYYNCSSSCIGKAIFDRTPSLKYLWTDYKYENIDTNRFHLNENTTKVYVYDRYGTYLGGFLTIHEASQKMNTTPGNISSIIKGKYLFNKKYYISDLKLDKFNIPNTITYADGFFKYDLEGNFIKHLKNIKELQQDLGVKNISGVHRAIRTGNTAYGFQWSNRQLPNMKKLNIYNSSRKVGKYTKDGQLVQVFNTVRQAKKDTCGAPNVLIGKRKTAGGFIWKYID